MIAVAQPSAKAWLAPLPENCKFKTTSMLLKGAKPKVISEALGHASVAFTTDVYSHIMEGMQEDAMALLDEVMPVGISKINNAKLTPITDTVVNND